MFLGGKANREQNSSAALFSATNKRRFVWSVPIVHRFDRLGLNNYGARFERVDAFRKELTPDSEVGTYHPHIIGDSGNCSFHGRRRK
jgi:hypothetical protein